MLVSVSISNQTCHLCRQNPATVSCTCTQPRILLCSHCIPLHTFKASQAPHVLLSPNVLPPSAELLEKQRAMRKNVSRLEECSAQVKNLMETVIVYMNHYSEWLLEELRKEREMLNAAVEGAIGETDICATQGLLPSSPLALAIWNLPVYQLESITMYSINSPNMQELCRSWVEYTNSLPNLLESLSHSSIHASIPYQPTVPYPSQLLAYIETDSIQVFNYCEKKWERHDLRPAVYADIHSRYVWTGKDLFCSGGGSPSWDCAYVLRQEERWTVRQVTGMLVARGRHGLWWSPTDAAVLVFGGTPYLGTRTLKSGLSDCEKMGMRSNARQKLPNMYDPRADFNPCELGNSLYLIGGSALVEVFNLSVCTFTQYPLEHPETDSPCCVFAVQGALVVISRNYMVRWKRQGVLIQQHKECEVLCNIPPVLDENRGVVYLAYEGWCSTITLDGQEQ